MPAVVAAGDEDAAIAQADGDEPGTRGVQRVRRRPAPGRGVEEVGRPGWVGRAAEVAHPVAGLLVDDEHAAIDELEGRERPARDGHVAEPGPWRPGLAGRRSGCRVGRPDVAAPDGGSDGAGVAIRIDGRGSADGDDGGAAAHPTRAMMPTRTNAPGRQAWAPDFVPIFAATSGPGGRRPCDAPAPVGVTRLDAGTAIACLGAEGPNTESRRQWGIRGGEGSSRGAVQVVVRGLPPDRAR